MTDNKILNRIRYTLKKQNLRVRTFRDGYGTPKYLVVGENNYIQNHEAGMTLYELAEYAGVSI